MIKDSLILKWSKVLDDYANGYSAQKIGYGAVNSPMLEHINITFDRYYRERLLIDKCLSHAETATEISHWAHAIISLNHSFGNQIFFLLENAHKQSRSEKKGRIKASKDGAHD